MTYRELALVAGGAAVGLTVGLLPVWDRDAPPDAPVAAPAQDGADQIGTDQVGAEGPGRAQADATPTPQAPAAPEAPPGEDAPLTISGPDGPVPCDAACVSDLTEAMLTGRLDGDARYNVYEAMSRIAERIAGDRDLTRRYLRQLSQLRVSAGQVRGEGPPPSARDEFGARDELVVALATSYDLPDGLAREAARVLSASNDAGLRAIGLSVTLTRDDPDAARDAVEAVLTREQGGEALVMALGYLPGLEGGVSPSASAAVDAMARDHADPAVRRAALEALLWNPGGTDAARRRTAERALRDADPGVRMAGIGGMLRADGGPPEPALLERMRGMTNAIANDPEAPPAARMEALGMLAYGAFGEGEGYEHRRYDH